MQTHPVLVARLMDMGWDVEPLALPCAYGESLLLPIYARIMPDTVSRCREVFSLSGPVLDLEGLERPSLPHDPARLNA